VSTSSPAPPAASAAAHARRLRLHNRVAPLLVAAAAAAVLCTGFVTIAANRLLSGRAIGLFAAADGRLSAAIVGLGLLLLVLAAARPSRALQRTAAGMAGALLLLVLAAAGEAATALAAAAPALARVSLGAAFWVLAGAAALVLVDALQRADAGPGGRLLAVAALAVAVFAMADAGRFDALSLAREYDARRAAFATALLRHVVLVAAAVGPAVLIGLPLGVGAARRPSWQGPLFAVLNLLQTIPSIALFALLIAPLSALSAALPSLAALGVGGVGPAPAIIALVLYALLPVVRNSVAGIAGVDPAVVDAARGMGMTGRQLLWRVQLPLALPLLIGGLRIVTVQAIGLAVVAALIGAGGLGSFVFAGLGQDAADLVLLGALPTIGLALAADLLLQSLSAAAAHRLAR
jgi:osmoprotectant transport system permease protein